MLADNWGVQGSLDEGGTRWQRTQGFGVLMEGLHGRGPREQGCGSLGRSLSPSHCRLSGRIPAEASREPRAGGSRGAAGEPSPSKSLPQPPPASPPHLHPAP